MSEQLNDKRKASERLFGALSGVDEKYLAACEADTGAKKPGGVVFFMSKYGKAMAAVLCLALLGIGYFSVQHVGDLSDKGATADCAPMNEMIQQECAMEMAPEAAVEEADQDAKVTDSATGSAERAEQEKAEMGNVVSDSAVSNSGMSDNLIEYSGTTSESKKEVDAEERKNYREGSADYIAQAQAMPLLGAYVPTRWPEEGAVMQLISDGGNLDNLVSTAWLFWSYDYQTEGFNVQINGYPNLEKWMEAEIAEGDVVWEKDYTRAYVESRMQPVAGNAAGLSVLDGELVEGHFGVLYGVEDKYVLVRFSGFGTMDEIWEMMQ